MTVPALIALAVVTLASPSLPADADEQWPAWRGPRRTGTAPHADPPVDWSESKNVRWKTAIPGRGNASPIVWNDRVYVTTALKTGAESRAGKADEPPPAADRPADGERGARRERGGRPRAEKPGDKYEYRVLALDRGDGRILWNTKVAAGVPHEGTHPDGTFASGSPVTDGEHVFAYFGSAGLFCLDLGGKVSWQTDLGDMHTRNSFGEGSSPALHGDTIVVTWDHEGDDFIVALDKRTGKERWRRRRDEPTTWSTPLIVEHGGRRQVVASGTNRVVAYDLETGETVWQGDGLTANVIPTPVCDGELVFLISGFRGHALRAVRLADARGDLAGGKAVAWSYDKDTPYVPSPLLHEGALYFFDNNRPILTCLDARTGEKRFGPQRIDGLSGVYASPVAAAGRVYVAGRDGETIVLKAGPTFEVLATNTLDDGFDASPAIAGRELFLRGRSHLYCVSATP